MGRPGYPLGLLDFLQKHADLTRRTVIADVGSGTGKLSALFLKNGNEVFCVEPNADMRTEAERLFSGVKGFHSVVGTAEATGLPRKSVDLVTAGQAFHWFDPHKARREFGRILRPPGWVMLVWNERRTDKGTFGEDYEKLVNRHRDRSQGPASEKAEARAIALLYRTGRVFEGRIENRQELDLDQFVARLVSSSYMPRSGMELAGVIGDAKRIFRKHAKGEKVKLLHTTKIHLGMLQPELP